MGNYLADVRRPFDFNARHAETIKKRNDSARKISHLKPLMDDIAKRQQAAQTDAEKMAISQELMSLYRDNGISMTGGIGCLPLLIQMPIFAALYAAIQYSPELSKSYFYGINLGHSSIILTILSFAAYALQGWLSMLGMPKEQRKQMQMMMFMSPAMITVMTFISPAGLGLYFFVGGVFACIQTLIINAMRLKIKQQIAEELKRLRLRRLSCQKPAPSKADVAKNMQKPIVMPENRESANKTTKRQCHA